MNRLFTEEDAAHRHRARPTWPRPRSRTCACSRRAWRSAASRTTCSVAAEIQRGLLPDERPDGRRATAWCGSNRPCRTVGGDYYDFVLRPGPAAARPGRRVRQGHRRRPAHDRACAPPCAATGPTSRPRKRWRRINRTRLPERHRRQVRHLLLSAAPRARRPGSVDYVNAGHNPPLLIRRDGTIETLNEGAWCWGSSTPMPYEEGVAELRAGDTLLIFSDGVTETWSIKGTSSETSASAKWRCAAAASTPPASRPRSWRELEVFKAGPSPPTTGL